MSHLQQFPLWTFLERDPELGGAWVAHVLDLDLVTQGETLEQALDMAYDAAATIILDDLKHDLNPRDRAAPQKYYDKLWALFRSAKAQQLTSIKKSEKDYKVVGIQIVVQLYLESHVENAHESPEPPVAWPEADTQLCA